MHRHDRSWKSPKTRLLVGRIWTGKQARETGLVVFWDKMRIRLGHQESFQKNEPVHRYQCDSCVFLGTFWEGIATQFAHDEDSVITRYYWCRDWLDIYFCQYSNNIVLVLGCDPIVFSVHISEALRMGRNHRMRFGAELAIEYGIYKP